MVGRGDPKRLKHDPQLALELAVCRDYKIPHSQFLAWSQDDRDKAIWSLVHERETCQGCGTRPAEWEDDLDAYQAQNHMCRGCRALEIGNEALKGAPVGMRVVLRRKGGPDGRRHS